MRLSVRRRFAWAMTGFGAAVACVFAFLALVAHETLEREILIATVRTEVDHVMSHIEQTGAAFLELDSVRAYLEPEHRSDVIPEVFRGLPEGMHDSISFAGQNYFVSVQQMPEGRLVVATDISTLQAKETEYVLLIAGATLAFLFLAWRIGLRIATGVADPLEQLAEKISGFRPEDRRAMDLHFDAPELVQIVDIFNSYLSRLDAFIVREQHLTGMTSHELRTPLAVIQGAAEVLLNRGNQDDADEKTLKRLQGAAHSMSNSVEAILWLAREDSERVKNTDQSDVSLIAQAVQENYQKSAEIKNLKLELVCPEATQVTAPSALLQIALGNLVRNAIQYTQQGFVRVIVGQDFLEVQDSGPGIADNQVNAVLQPLQRGQQEISEGHGYGLYIVNEICQRLNWKLAFQSTEGGGAVIRIQFASESQSASPTKQTSQLEENT